LLSLSFNQLSSLPTEITHLTNLRTLNLRNAQLNRLPTEVIQLANLRSLNLGGNQLSNLPTEVTRLTNLRTLYLGGNQLSSLPVKMSQLQALEVLDLEANQFTNIPIEIRQLTQLKKLDLRGNPIPIPPEILGGSWDSLGKPADILKFYFRVQDPDETELFYEAKLLVLGEGGAGKTSLAKKIANEAYTLQDEDTTQGIDVIQWQFELQNGQDFRANVWDFGGQEIYHQTHQFFLTEHSLYLLLADTRKENTDFYYWIVTTQAKSAEFEWDRDN
jgi:hypothetical protein